MNKVRQGQEKRKAKDLVKQLLNIGPPTNGLELVRDQELGSKHTLVSVTFLLPGTSQLSLQIQDKSEQHSWYKQFYTFLLTYEDKMAFL